MNAMVRLVSLMSLIAATGLMSSATQADATTPISAYYGNTLLCQNQTSKAVCHVWLNQDGSYFVMYDRGVQPGAAVPGGNFRIEGRRGKYEVKAKDNEFEVCLKPDANPGVKLNIEAAGEAYAGAKCYGLPQHTVGESWMQEVAGQQYKMWLVKGHG